jgi:hypothetical protein
MLDYFIAVGFMRSTGFEERALSGLRRRLKLVEKCPIRRKAPLIPVDMLRHGVAANSRVRTLVSFCVLTGLRFSSLVCIDPTDVIRYDDRIDVIVRRDKVSDTAGRSISFSCNCDTEFGNSLCPLCSGLPSLPIDPVEIDFVAHVLKITSHSFRRTLLMMLVLFVAKLNNISLDQVRQRFGWSSVSMVFYYSMHTDLHPSRYFPCWGVLKQIVKTKAEVEDSCIPISSGLGDIHFDSVCVGDVSKLLRVSVLGNAKWKDLDCSISFVQAWRRMLKLQKLNRAAQSLLKDVDVEMSQWCADSEELSTLKSWNLKLSTKLKAIVVEEKRFQDFFLESYQEDYSVKCRGRKQIKDA